MCRPTTGSIGTARRRWTTTTPSRVRCTIAACAIRSRPASERTSRLVTLRIAKPMKGNISTPSEIAVHYAMANRELTYSATEAPELSHFEHEAPSKWSSNLAGQLEGEEGTAAARVGEKIASEIEGSGVSDPYATEVAIPSACSVGSKRAKCLVELEELELVPEVTELDWDEAVVEELEELEPEETREEESERIIEISPPVETTVTTGTDVELTTNPVEEDMPEFVPKPDPGEKGDEFKERKFACPIWLPHVTTLDDATLDPSKGPRRSSPDEPGGWHPGQPARGGRLAVGGHSAEPGRCAGSLRQLDAAHHSGAGPLSADRARVPLHGLPLRPVLLGRGRDRAVRRRR